MKNGSAIPSRISRVGSASALIRARLDAIGVRYFANDTIGEHLSPEEVAAVQLEVEDRAHDLLSALVIDTDNDHNTRDTAKRIARMFVREVFAGRYHPRPDVMDFPNAKQLDEVYTVGPITVRSTCAHHLCPIQGQAWCGVIPGERVIGLSKFNRLCDWVLSRPQIQEEAVIQLADELEAAIKPRGLAVVLRATHACMTWRGVREQSSAGMTALVTRGLLREPERREEFLSLIRAGSFECR